MTLAVIVITYNEAQNIQACLQSVRWADELIVVDAFSSDRTVEIAKTMTRHVYVTEWQGYAANKNYALDRVTSEWVLWLDADERVTAELAAEIKTLLHDPSFDAYQLPRKAIFLGKWIKHCGWYPGYVTRLFKKGSARFNDKLVHEGLDYRHKAGRCRNDIIHFTDRSLEHYISKLNRYTTLAAQELNSKGRRSGLVDILFRPMHMFLRMFLLRRGFLDGFHGLLLSLLSSFYVLVKYAKLWHLNDRENAKADQSIS